MSYHYQVGVTRDHRGYRWTALDGEETIDGGFEQDRADAALAAEDAIDHEREQRRLEAEDERMELQDRELAYYDAVGRTLVRL